MKTTMMILLGMCATTAAMADGFLCEGQNTGLVFKLYNHIHAEDGTRTAAIMIISDPKVAYGNKTIATFSDAKRTLSSKNVVYAGKVDLRVLVESARKGENIAGTKLGQLATIAAEVFFHYTYDTPSLNGEEKSGIVTYTKRNGEVLEEKLSCTRYKKN